MACPAAISARRWSSVGDRGHHVVKAMALCPLTRRLEHAGLDVQDVDHCFGADDLGNAHSFST
jgi:hypothetical protein